MKYAFEISDVRGDYLRDCDFRRFAGTPLRLLVTGFVCWLPQTNAECRVPTVRRPSPKRRVVRPALLRRTSATQMTGGATLQLCL